MPNTPPEVNLVILFDMRYLKQLVPNHWRRRKDKMFDKFKLALTVKNTITTNDDDNLLEGV